jgi:phosphomannomutase
MRGELAAVDMAPEPQTVGALATAAGVSFGTSGVRGLVDAFTSALCHAYVQAFLSLAEPRAKRLLIGHDLRPSSPDIAALCHHSARLTGWDTCHAGAVPTPALAFAAQELGFPAVMITGSHTPFDHNGIKFHLGRGEITKADKQAMRLAFLPSIPCGPAGVLPEADPQIIRHYVCRYLDVVPATALSDLRIGVFEHSSVARDLLHTVLETLDADTVSLGRTYGFVAIDTEVVRPAEVAISPAWASAQPSQPVQPASTQRATGSRRSTPAPASACWRGSRATGRPCAPSSPLVRGLSSRSTRPTVCV